MGDHEMSNVITWRWDDHTDALELWQLIHADREVDAVVVLGAVTDVADSLEYLVALLDEPLAASVSPIPLSTGSNHRVVRYALSEALPPPPTLAIACSTCVVFAADALRIAWPDPPSPTCRWPQVASSISMRLVERGWRHVGAPGVGLAWSGAAAGLQARWGWSDSVIAEIDGDGNESLATHRLWATTRSDIDVVIDGPCLDGDPHNGSQALVLDVARSMALARPSANVRVAVVPEHRGAVQRSLGGAVEVIERKGAVDADVIYRPYQLLVPSDLPWLIESGRRLLVGQLDMIGFSNPSYHPSPALFHSVRNLQRLTMRVADGVTFISEFGRRSAVVECPDLEASRCFVVYSGASTPPHSVREPTARPTPYVACLSALFWHKNREHAIRTFAAMVATHGYGGELRIAGPEPFYGRSTADETALLAALPAGVRERVRYLGQIDESSKWELLAGADVIIYPSVAEGFGMVPFEAAAVGTPSMVAPSSALVEIFEGTGAVVRSWNENVWAAHATAMVADPSASRDVVGAITTRAEQYSWHRVAGATWRAIDEVVARPRARLHREEGGLRSRVAVRSEATPMSAPVHFANRLVAFASRNLPRPRTRD